MLEKYWNMIKNIRSETFARKQLFVRIQSNIDMQL